MTIEETCPCGAMIRITERYRDYCEEAAQNWRENHKHTEPLTEGKYEVFGAPVTSTKNREAETP